MLLHIAKGKSQGNPAIGGAAETARLLEAVASPPNLARALLNVLSNKGNPRVARVSEGQADGKPGLVPPRWWERTFAITGFPESPSIL